MHVSMTHSVCRQICKLQVTATNIYSFETNGVISVLSSKHGSCQAWKKQPWKLTFSEREITSSWVISKIPFPHSSGSWTPKRYNCAHPDTMTVNLQMINAQKSTQLQFWLYCHKLIHSFYAPSSQTQSLLRSISIILSTKDISSLSMWRLS